MFRVRRADDTDIDDVSAMDLECLPLDQAPPITWDSYHWWVAEWRDGSSAPVPAGYAAMRPSTRWSDAVYMARAGVLPFARGAGLQRRLLRTREACARRAGYLWAVTDTLNPRSMNSLIHAGYRAFEPSEPWAGGSTYWRKRLGN